MARMTSRKLLYLPLRLLRPGDKSRQRLTPAMQELAASIRQVGILQPLTVQKHPRDYTVVSGNRRLMAAHMAGLGEAPCLLLSSQDPALISLTENLQREDLGYFREAELLQDYLRRTGLSQSQAACRLGRSQSAVANKLRLLGHGPAVRQALEEHGLSERHARELLRLPQEDQRLRCIREIAASRFTVAQTERYIDTLLCNSQAPLEQKLRRRDTRLFLERTAREAESLRRGGVDAQWSRQEQAGDILVTIRIHAGDFTQKSDF